MEGRITRAGFWKRGREVTPDQRTKEKQQVQVQPISTGANAGQFYNPNQEVPISALPSPERISKVCNARSRPVCINTNQQPW